MSSFTMAAANSISSTVALTSRSRAGRFGARAGAVRPVAVAASEVAEVAIGAGGAAAFLGVVGGVAAISVLSAARIEQRVEEATKKAEGYGIDLSDLYYDFDVPGDQYPFGDGEDWMPKSWKPPKTGDSKYLPTKMLGQIQIRLNQYEAIKECEAAGVEIGDLCVPFEDYTGEFDTNAKRLQEMRRRLEASK